jgi:hypothetical protein
MLRIINSFIIRQRSVILPLRRAEKIRKNFCGQNQFAP